MISKQLIRLKNLFSGPEPSSASGPGWELRLDFSLGDSILTSSCPSAPPYPRSLLEFLSAMLLTVKAAAPLSFTLSSLHATYFSFWRVTLQVSLHLEKNMMSKSANIGWVLILSTSLPLDK
jgi:hypothetical protein